MHRQRTEVEFKVSFLKSTLYSDFVL